MKCMHGKQINQPFTESGIIHLAVLNKKSISEKPLTKLHAHKCVTTQFKESCIVYTFSFELSTDLPAAVARARLRASRTTTFMVLGKSCE